MPEREKRKGSVNKRREGRIEADVRQNGQQFKGGVVDGRRYLGREACMYKFETVQYPSLQSQPSEEGQRERRERGFQNFHLKESINMRSE